MRICVLLSLIACGTVWHLATPLPAYGQHETQPKALDKITGLSPIEQSWANLFFAGRPVVSTERFFLPLTGRKGESPADYTTSILNNHANLGLKEFLNHPVVQDYSKKGREFFEEYYGNLLVEAQKKYGFSFSVDSIKKIPSSFEDWLRSSQKNGDKKRKLIDAESLARQDFQNIGIDIQSLDLNSPYRREYEKLVRRYEEQPIPGGLNSKRMAEQFEDWKKHEIEKLERIAAENLKKALLLEMAHFKTLHPYLVDNSQVHSPDIAARDLAKMKLIVEFQGKTFTGNFSNETWAVDGKGKKWLLTENGSSVGVSSVAFRVFRSDLHGKSQNHLAFAAMTEVERVNEALLSMYRVLSDLKFKDSPKEIRNKLIAEKNRLLQDWSPIKAKRINVFFGGSDLDGIEWWGYRQNRVLGQKMPDFNYWKNRDNGTFAIPIVEEPAPLHVGGRALTPKEKLEALVQSDSHLYDEKSKPTNKAKSPKKTQFKISATSDKARIPNFLNRLSRQSVPLGKEASFTKSRLAEFVIESLETVPHTNGILEIPTADRHALTWLGLTDSVGRKLVLGKDYQLYEVPGQDVYFAKIKNPTEEEYRISAGFLRKTGSKAYSVPTELYYLDIKKLSVLVNELKETGFTTLAKALDGQIKKQQKKGQRVSVVDVISVFENLSRYSYVAEKDTSHLNTRFGVFLKFLDESGHLCVQCDGANNFGAEFLKAYFDKDPNVSIRVRSVYTRNGAVFGEDLTHAQIEFRWKGEKVLVLDQTPRRKDSRNPPKQKSTEVVKVPTPILREELPPSPEERYLKELRELREKTFNAFEKHHRTEKRSFRVERDESFAITLRVTDAVGEFLAGEKTLEQTRARLQKVLPGYIHGYTNTDGLMALVSQVASEQKEILEVQLQKYRHGANKVQPEYLDPTRREVLVELLSALEKASPHPRPALRVGSRRCGDGAGLGVVLGNLGAGE